MLSVAVVTVYKSYEIYYYNIERENGRDRVARVCRHTKRERQIAKR
jgi:hypothetical protein